MSILLFLRQCLRLALRGGLRYYSWLGLLLALIIWGGLGYAGQLREGLAATSMRDPISWGFYIGNFTFLVGIAAASITLVIPAYIYHWSPIKEVVILGEVLAVSAIMMCELFVFVDIGRPDRAWHLMPELGKINFPNSLLAWDVMVLNIYLVLNLVIIGYILYSSYVNKPYRKGLVGFLILLSVPMAVGIHTVTAFLYNGLAARPYWNSSILAPRFLASAFCSGPAVMIIVFQLLQRTSRFRIKIEALWKIAELMAYAMFINLFLLGAEIFREYYSGTKHLAHTQFLYTGLSGHTNLVPFAWISVAFSIAAFILFLIPATRKNLATLNLGCFLIYSGVFIEKGIALVIPGFVPSSLGEIYEYVPTLTELRVAAAIFSTGFLVFTILCRITIAIATGELNRDNLNIPVTAGVR